MPKIIALTMILMLIFSGRTLGASAENKTGLGSIWISFEKKIGNFWEKITQTLFTPEKEQESGQEKMVSGNKDIWINEAEKIELAIPSAEPFPAPAVLAPKKTPCLFFKTPLTCLFPKKTKAKKENGRPENGSAAQNIAPEQDSSIKNPPAASSSYSPPAKTPAPTSTQTVSAPPKQNPSATDADALINSVFDESENEEDIVSSEDDLSNDDDLDEIINIFDDSDFE